MIRRTGFVVFSLLALLTLAWIVVLQVVDADFVEHKLNEALSQFDAEPQYQAHIGDLDLKLLRRSAILKDIALLPVPIDTTSADSLSGPAAPLQQLRISRLEIFKVGLFPLIFKKKVRLEAFAIADADVALALPQQDTSAAPDTTAARPAGAQRDSLYARIARTTPKIELGRLQLENVSFTLLPGDSTASNGTMQVDSIFVLAEDILVNEAAAADSARLLFSKTLDVQIYPQQFVIGDSLYAISTGHIQSTFPDATISLAGIRVAPLLSEAAFNRRMTYRKDRFDFDLTGLQLEGMDFSALATGAFRSTSARIDSFYLDVYKDKRLPQDPDKPVPPTVQEAFQSIGLPVHLDTFRVATGKIQYREVVEDGEHPGAVTFEDVGVLTTNITNADSLRGYQYITTVDANAYLMGEGALQVTFDVPLMAPGFNILYRGRLGSMPATSISPLLENLQGARIEAGVIDSLVFDVTVVDALSDGELVLAYHDLEMEFLDKVDGSRKLGDRLKTFFVNDLMVHPDNPNRSGKDLRTSRTVYEKDADPFFRFFWRSLRNAIKDSIDRI